MVPFSLKKKNHISDENVVIVIIFQSYLEWKKYDKHVLVQAAMKCRKIKFRFLSQRW